MTIVFLLQSVSPVGSELSSLDYYLLVSLIFVFGALVELAFVLVAKRTLQLLCNNSRDTSAVTNSRLNTQIQDAESAIGSNDIAFVDTDCPGLRIPKPRMDIFVMEEQVRKHPNEVSKPSPKYSLFSKISMATKFDFLAFVVFNLCYIVFNVVHFSKF